MYIHSGSNCAQYVSLETNTQGHISSYLVVCDHAIAIAIL